MTTATTILNPLYDEWFRITGGAEMYTRSYDASAYRARSHFCKQYAWAIPNDEALAAIAAYSPIVELGAGTGYWASLLTQLGARVVCFDNQPPATTENDYGHRVEYHPVRRGGPESVVNFSDHALMLCWPPMSSMAADALACYHGQTVIYIGESDGCTATDEFREQLENEWTLVREIDIPQWDAIHDYVMIYQKKSRQA